MRLAIIVPDCGEGGLFQFYNSLVPALADHADVHLVFASMVHSPLEPQVPGAVCHKLAPENAAPILAALLNGPLAIAPNLARALAAAWQAWEFAKRLTPDCVELCDWPLAAVPGIIDGSLPLVIQAHGSMGQIASHDALPGTEVETALAQLIEAQVFGHALHLQSHSHANSAWWSATTRRQVAMVRPAFPLPALPSHDAAPSARMSVFGRLQAWKGPQVLCEALHLLGDRAPDCDWYGGAKHWPGSGLAADAHLARAFPGVWSRSLQHHGAIPRSEVPGRMAASRAVIVPSTWDVFNFTAVEAMAAARPVIVSEGAGAAELIDHGCNGFTFPAGDAADLAAALHAVASMSDQEATEMGLAARKTVADHLDPARIATERMAHYRAAVADQGAAPPVPDWLRELLGPGAKGTWRMKDFLRTLPVRPMVSAVAERMTGKLARTGGRG